jgi:hypothetical protein
MVQQLTMLLLGGAGAALDVDGAGRGGSGPLEINEAGREVDWFVVLYFCLFA